MTGRKQSDFGNHGHSVLSLIIGEKFQKKDGLKPWFFPIAKSAYQSI